ncbi:MAG: response regulator transcription factor [Deltaproteobacteria bacterium]|nr:response regulator transcription factor [Deltaproteobacteria bacterium]
MNNPIIVVIATQQKLFREAVCRTIHDEKSIQIAGETDNIHDVVDLIRQYHADIFLLDSALITTDIAELTHFIKEQNPSTRTLVLADHPDEDMIFHFLRAGVKGYISKDTGIASLVKAIDRVHQGELWVERKFLFRYIEHESDKGSGNDRSRHRTYPALTAREEEVLRCLTLGHTNKEIAEKLFIAEKTVKTHLNNIFKKLNVTHRIQAILYAIGQGLNNQQNPTKG